jgi:hypothetical protein
MFERYTCDGQRFAFDPKVFELIVNFQSLRFERRIRHLELASSQAELANGSRQRVALGNDVIVG